MIAIPAKNGIKTYMISFRRGDLVLEELTAFLKKEGIDAALIGSGIGSFDVCNIHTIADVDLPPRDLYTTLKGPVEIGALHGSVAGGEPHIHVVVHDVKADKVHVGHLEKGSRCCYRVELGLTALTGVKTTRKSDPATGLIDILPVEG
jgi:predicted DNA-binding protein with PD1-like motif